MLRGNLEGFVNRPDRELSAMHVTATALDIIGAARRTGSRVAEVLEQIERDYPNWNSPKGLPVIRHDNA